MSVVFFYGIEYALSHFTALRSEAASV